MKTTIRSILITFTLLSLGLVPITRAVNPPPDGGYPGANTAEGENALFNLSSQDGSFNTAAGWYSLFSNVVGSFNTAFGAGALDLNTSHNNTAVGAGALFLNTTGNGNTATGAFALVSNSTGFGNTATGGAALFSNTTGFGNTAVGGLALFSNTEGPGNTAVGAQALQKLSGFAPSSSGNTALGAEALTNTTEGNFSTAVGFQALTQNVEGRRNTAIGSGALAKLGHSPNCSPSPSCTPGPTPTPGDDNIAVGTGAGLNLITGSDNIYIGNPGMDEESNTIRIGTNPGPTASPTPTPATYIAHISGAIVPGGVPVIVDSDGHLGTIVSSQRFKDEIQPMDEASTAILALKPVTFRYKKGIDPQRITQFGLVAEEVEKVNPDLVARDKEGKPYTVRYEAVNAMLLNEFLKEHKAFVEEHRTVEELKKQVAALTAGLQKVSAQLELSKAAPQTVSLPAVALREGGNNQ